MKKKFILEFSEEQQQFHENYGMQEPNTNGYITIDKNCSKKQWMLFQIFINRGEIKHFTAFKLNRQWEEFKSFYDRLKENGLDIFEEKSN